LNPLDKEELAAFTEIMNKEMPLYTNTSAKIPRSYSQGLPKNLMEYSAKVYDRFLNNHQHIIKEMEYRQKLSSTVKK